MSASSTKSPISILQELAAAKLISTPEYKLTDELNGFKCEVKIDDLTICAASYSKKVAKHLCASEALEILKSQNDVDNSSGENPYKKDCCLSNAIGKLNELCSQKRIDLPVYVDKGCSNGNFVFECSCLSYTTEGRSPTKKLAKRLAANEMLKKNEFVKLMKTSATVEAKVIAAFKEINIGQSEQYAVTEYNEIGNAKEDDANVKETLITQLQTLGYVHNVIVLQEVPLMLALKVMKSIGADEQTYVRSCESYKEGLVKLLRRAVDVAKIVDV